jgi:hypothetical protein
MNRQWKNSLKRNYGHTRLEGSALFFLKISTQTREKIRNCILHCCRLSLYSVVWVSKFFHTANWKQNNFPAFSVIVQRGSASTKLVMFFKFAAKLESPPPAIPCFAASPPRRTTADHVSVFLKYILDRSRYTPWSRQVTDWMLHPGYWLFPKVIRC